MTSSERARESASSTSGETTKRSVLVSLAVNVAELVGLAITAWLTSSSALFSQATANAADVAVASFLFIGVLASSKPADDTHPVGYGRERFFWSLLAALGIFVGGGGLAIVGAVQSALHPSTIHSYLTAYLVLVACIALDAYALATSVRPLIKQAAKHRRSLFAMLVTSTDPTSVTVAVGSGGALFGGVIATIGVGASQLFGSELPDTIAGALIGVMLLVGSALLLKSNRELLTGRSIPVPILAEMRSLIEEQPGIITVQDLFGIVIGPASVVVDGDVTLSDDLDVPAAEVVIKRAITALRERWPKVVYVYLTPVAVRRPSRANRRGKSSKHGRSRRVPRMPSSVTQVRRHGRP